MADKYEADLEPNKRQQLHKKPGRENTKSSRPAGGILGYLFWKFFFMKNQK